MTCQIYDRRREKPPEAVRGVTRCRRNSQSAARQCSRPTRDLSPPPAARPPFSRPPVSRAMAVAQLYAVLAEASVRTEDRHRSHERHRNDAFECCKHTSTLPTSNLNPSFVPPHLSAEETRVISAALDIVPASDLLLLVSLSPRLAHRAHSCKRLATAVSAEATDHDLVSILERPRRNHSKRLHFLRLWAKMMYFTRQKYKSKKLARKGAKPQVSARIVTFILLHFCGGFYVMFSPAFYGPLGLYFSPRFDVIPRFRWESLFAARARCPCSARRGFHVRSETGTARRGCHVSSETGARWNNEP